MAAPHQANEAYELVAEPISQPNLFV